MSESTFLIDRFGHDAQRLGGYRAAVGRDRIELERRLPEQRDAQRLVRRENGQRNSACERDVHRCATRVHVHLAAGILDRQRAARSGDTDWTARRDEQDLRRALKIPGNLDSAGAQIT